MAASASSTMKVSFDGLQAVPAAVMEGTQQKQYAWDGRRLRALEAEDWEQGAAAARTLRGRIRHAVHDLRSAFFPNPDESLLQAVGVGARRSLPAAATINWVLKDGLGRLGRLTVATRFGESFDSDLKRFRYATSIIYAVSLSLEFLTPLAPQHFLVMASLANVGKSIGLTTFIATQPAFHRSFCLRENLADISAKTQAQQMVMDNIGLAAAVGLTYLCRHTEAARRALPLVMFPLLAAGDLWAIYSELRSIHLRTLNKERAEIIAQHWLREGRVPSPRQVSEEERFVLPPHIEVGRMPLTISSLDQAVQSSQDLQLLEQQDRGDHYFLTFTSPGGSSSSPSSSSSSSDGSGPAGRGRRGLLPPPLPLPWQLGRHAGSVRVCLRQDAAEPDIVQAVLQAAYLRQLLGVPPAGSRHPVASAADDRGSAVDVQQAVTDSGSKARGSLKPFISQLQEQGWQLAPFMLSSTEKQRYLRFWTGLIYTPYVPRGDIDADDLLVQIPKNCSDKLLSDKLKRRCNACASRTTLKSCLATNAQTWHQSKDIESCTWVSYNARHETVRELNFTLGVNFPNYYISRTDPRICAVTREYTVESGPEYTASYFTSFGDVVRDDGTDLPWGLRPEAGCAVKWPETKCRLKFYQTPNISVAVSQRDMLACVVR
ncbi:hypothetical protein CHLNCDRAFT_138052 [Chlorella variabilis]|uniref:DUF647 domain-containing protein n=1 Tax=Chlorella variabilis TaxID=554065 RepID=E1Z554_CHLVA|nr:hypothetical protein CHLNCDRAFT_138052 [Chlorella variabilis]EFN59464.1 hypothetical protein CHLNCDRAFT_138052 [Chlorella variabilis]|eukprot:XP_005851566.1 hypothetical protein CHLNCDRAFT_138052 [Chlorella variabilis]